MIGSVRGEFNSRIKKEINEENLNKPKEKMSEDHSGCLEV